MKDDKEQTKRLMLDRLATDIPNEIAGAAEAAGAVASEVMTLLTAINANIILMLPGLEPGGEIALMEQMRRDVIRIVGNGRIMDGPTQGRG